MVDFVECFEEDLHSVNAVLFANASTLASESSLSGRFVVEGKEGPDRNVSRQLRCFLIHGRLRHEIYPVKSTIKMKETSTQITQSLHAPDMTVMTSRRSDRQFNDVTFARVSG